MTDYLKREDVMDLFAGHTTEHDCPCAQILATLALNIPADPVAAAAIRLAKETDENWVNLGGRVTPKMRDALASYRAAVEAAK